MRTFLIAPSFMAVFAVTIFSVGWLLAVAGGTTSPNLGNMPSTEAFAAWHSNMPIAGQTGDPVDEVLHERTEEVQFN